MIESFFEELPPIPNDETKVSELAEDVSFMTNSEDSLLAALPVVQKIVRRKVLFSRQSEDSDMVQGITLRLWKWRNKYREKSEEMSPDEWQSFAARTTYNEINRHFSNGTFLDVPLDATSDVVAQESIEGGSDAEVYSLVRLFWQEICCLSLRQRRALLLHSQELIIYFLKSGIGDDELAGILNFTMDEWIDVKSRLPLNDVHIANLTQETDSNRSIESIAKSIKKARYEARAKMRRLTEK